MSSKYSSEVSSPTSPTPTSSVSSAESPLVSLNQTMAAAKGCFYSEEVSWAYSFDPTSAAPPPSSGDQWKQIPLEINAQGQLKAHGNVVIAPHVQQCTVRLYAKHLVIKVGITSQKVIYFKAPNYTLYNELLSSLMVWQNLRPKGLAAKWNYSKSIVYDSKYQANDVLVCRFKVYGPLPNNKKVKIDRTLPPTPLYPSTTTSGDTPIEGWFVVIGHLLPTGQIHFLCESDGSLLYSVNVASLFSSEVRQVHHSVVQTSNVLFLGVIPELRSSHRVEDEFGTAGEFLVPAKNASSVEAKHLAQCQRILIDFELGIDLEDWFVALQSVTSLEYTGRIASHRKLRVIRDARLEIIEATFDKNVSPGTLASSIYCELRMWDAPWFRTSVAQCSSGAFWKESTDLVLPAGTEYFKIVIKATKNGSEEYDKDGVDTDSTVGACYITPNFFTVDQFLTKVHIFDSKNRVLGQLTINLTIDETHVLPYKNYRVFEKMLDNMNISRLLGFIVPLTTSQNLEPWSIMLLDVFQTLHKEHEFFNALMKRELAPIDSITRTTRVSRNSFTPSSSELSKSSSSHTTSSSVYQPPPQAPATTAAAPPPPTFNTIFRGNSMLSKAFEKYDLRVGREYLEKLLGSFIQQVVDENLDCECDPKACPDAYKENYASLLRYLEILWHRIYITSNDLPSEMRLEWKNLRRNVELSVEPSDTETPLNALSAFIFLRFLCPAILNPQLFNLTKGHHSGRISRTLTLIAKVLLVFANRSHFQPHKDPSLLRLNEDFIDRHSGEVLVYFDRVTGCKMDFNEKILELSNLKDRLSLNASKEVLNELPTMPYLIDKYLKLSKLAKILAEHGGSESSSVARRVHAKQESLATTLGPPTEPPTDRSFELLSGFDESELSSGGFLKNLLEDSDDEEFSNILFKRDFSIRELADQAKALADKTRLIDRALAAPESPNQFDEKAWTLFVDSIFKSVRMQGSGAVKYDPFVAHNYALGKRDHTLKDFLETLTSQGGSHRDGRYAAHQKGHDGLGTFKKFIKRKFKV